MNETEWRTCSNPFEMLDYLASSGISDQKLRLLSVACCRLISGVFAISENSKALDVAEQFAQGLADANQLAEARRSVVESQRRIPEMDFSNNAEISGALRASAASAYTTHPDAKLGARKTLDQTARVLTLLSVGRWDETADKNFKSLMNIQLARLAAIIREHCNPFIGHGQF